MPRVVRFLVTGVATLLLVLGGVEAATASMEIGCMSVGNYTCMPNRDSANVFTYKLKNRMCQIPNTISQYRYTDTACWDLRMMDVVNDVDLFTYSGHGRDRNQPIGGVYQGASVHWTAKALGDTNHYTYQCNDNNVNTTWDDLCAVGLGAYPGYLKWAYFYTCNYLKASETGDNEWIWDMFDGLHSICGFARVMYIESDQGTDIGNRLSGGSSIVNSWKLSSQLYQSPHDETIAKWYYAKSCLNDTWYGYVADPPSFLNGVNNSLFAYSYVTIP